MKTIRVTQADIDNGVRWSASRCPLALAIQRRVKPKVSVGMTKFSVGSKLLNLPPRAQDWVQQVDFGDGVVKPTSFRLPL